MSLDAARSRHGLPFKKLVTATLEHSTLAITAAVSILPLYLMLIASLEGQSTFRGESLFPTGELSLDNYVTAITSLGFGSMAINTTMLSLSASLLAVTCATAAAFGLISMLGRQSGWALAAILSLMTIPPVVLVIPLFLFMVDLGWINSYQSAILVEAGIIIPFDTFLIYTFMKRIPAELLEAAKVDGAPLVRQFRSIVVPLARPAIVTALIVSVVVVWNDLLIPLIFWPSDRLKTLMVGLALLGPGRSGLRDVPLLMAGVAISIIPLFVLYLVSRRALVRGLVQGSGK